MPALHEFDWSTSGETPRRSARISEKAKAVSPPEPQPKKKRSKRSSSKNNANVETAPEEIQEQKDGGVQEDSPEKKHNVETQEANKTGDAKVAEGAPADYKHESTEKSQDFDAITLQDNGVVSDKIEKQGNEKKDLEGSVAKPDSVLSNVKHYGDGRKLFDEHQTNTGDEKQSLNVAGDAADKSTEEKDDQQKQQNFQKPVRIEAQQHLPPTLSC